MKNYVKLWQIDMRTYCVNLLSSRTKRKEIQTKNNFKSLKQLLISWNKKALLNDQKKMWLETEQKKRSKALKSHE